MDAVNKLSKRKGRKGFSTPPKINDTSLTLYQRPRFVRPAPVNIVAPENFSLVNNTEETIKYFNRAHEELKKKNRIAFDILCE